MILTHTKQLVSIQPLLGRSFADVVKHSSGSAAGYSVNSEWLTCPEKSRLRSKGVRHKGFRRAQTDEDELSALDFGTLMHELLRVRVWYGHQIALETLDFWRHDVRGSYTKAALMLGVYEQQFPYAFEALQFVGVECEVVTNIRMGENDPRPCYRSVRYDGVVRARGADGSASAIYSLERKTTARSGGLSSYYTQGMIQQAVWNANAELVAQHGPMVGVIFETLVKTKMPSCDRYPETFSLQQQKEALEYMRLSENGGAVFRMKPDGTFPKMLHACWGKYSPCDFISLCHDNVTGDYTQNGEEM